MQSILTFYTWWWGCWREFRVKGQGMSIWTGGPESSLLLFFFLLSVSKMWTATTTALIFSSQEEESTAQCPSRHVIIKYYITSPAGRWCSKLRHPGSSQHLLWFRFFLSHPSWSPCCLSSQLERNRKKKGRTAGEQWGQTTQHCHYHIFFFTKARIFVEQPAKTETVI